MLHPLVSSRAEMEHESTVTYTSDNSTSGCWPTLAVKRNSVARCVWDEYEEVLATCAPSLNGLRLFRRGNL